MKKDPSGDAPTQKISADDYERVDVTGVEVEVASGPDAGLSAKLGACGLVVGTGAECDLRLSDPRVSRRHLELRAERDGVRLLDADSTNGTYVGGARVLDARLSQDALVSVGATTLELRLRGRAVLEVSPRTRFGEAVARSDAMRHVFALLERAAMTDVTVLLEGQSGTGKDVLARSLHQEGTRSDGPFVVVDCGAIPDNLVESELFGHERGAFTGAVAARAGAFEQAHGGTVFLDEVGELPLEAQPKLLRALENRSFRRVGGSQVVDVDVRVVAATNRRLVEAVRKREFREDLYYRLAVVHIAVPRLAERPDDIIPLAEAFLRRIIGDSEAKIPRELVGPLVAYPWPGNARELRNAVERFATFDRADPRLLFGGDAPAHAGSLGPVIDLETLSLLPYHEAKRRLLDALDRVVVPRAIERSGSVQRAAESLGIPRPSLYRILQRAKDDAT